MNQGNKSSKPSMSKDKDPKDKGEKDLTLIEEFKEFIARGNVIELAVGLTVGTAFTALVKSLVDNLIMPIVGVFFSGEAFTEQFFALNGQIYENLAAAEEAGAPLLKYGQLINDTLNFLIIALVVFFMVKAINTFRRKFKSKE